MPTDIRAIVGLGNPGSGYELTRHNAGFWFVDALADKYGADYRKETKFHGVLAEITIRHARESGHPELDSRLRGNDSTRLLLLKPATWMNGSGRAVQALMQFHKFTPDQIMVAHDELDLPCGTVRLKIGGGHGGHNGLRDTHAQIGPDYRRLRIGVGHPGQKELVTDYLTSGRASAADQKLINEAIEAAVEVMPLALEHWEKATQQLHSRPESPLPASRGEG